VTKIINPKNTFFKAIDRTLEDYDNYKHEASGFRIDDLSREEQLRQDWYRAANRFPSSAYKDYLDALNDYVDIMGEVVDDFWEKRISHFAKRMIESSSLALDQQTQDDLQDNLQQAMDQLERRLEQVRTGKSSYLRRLGIQGKAPNMRAEVNRMVRQVKRKAVNNFQQEVQRVLGPDFQPMVRGKKLDMYVKQAVESNTKLVKSIQGDYHDNLSRTIYNGVQQGVPIDDLAQQIGHEFDVAKSRTKVISLDQTNSLHSAINRAQHKELGLSSYHWYGILDSKIRATHEANHCNEFKWKNPPPTGHPGSAIACRCFASPIESDLREYASSGSSVTI